MNGDTFINNSTKQNTVSSTALDNNFFLGQKDDVNILSEPTRRLNDYDSNILREGAYKDITDELLKLEYKISKLEEELADIETQIQGAEDINDLITLEYLRTRREQIKEDLSSLVEIYNDKGISAKISGGILTKFKKPIAKFKNAFWSFSDGLVSHLPGKFSAVPELKSALNKLEIINKSVDELMTLQTPYGEAEDKYEQLSKYIVRANAIQAQITKSLK